MQLLNERKVSSYCVSASLKETKLAIRKCGGSLNLFLMSANLLPEYCASTVSTIALKPARSARWTNFAVTLKNIGVRKLHSFGKLEQSECVQELSNLKDQNLDKHHEWVGVGGWWSKID